jgi:hypothetical protein
MAERIIFNGKVYRSVSEMSPDVRQLYERIERLIQDADRDGVPDIMQRGGLEGIKEAFGFLKDMSKMRQVGQWTADQLVIIKETDTSITINGKTFRNINEMPSDVRAVYQKAVSQADPASIGIYDEPWRERKRESYFTPHDDEISKSRYNMPTSSNVIQPENTNISLLLAIVLAVLVCVGAGVYFYISSGNFF